MSVNGNAFNISVYVEQVYCVACQALVSKPTQEQAQQFAHAHASHRVMIAGVVQAGPLGSRRIELQVWP